MQRLLPDPGPTAVAEQVATLDLVALAHEGRPYVITNFALTLDGRATIGGRSGPIGSDADTAMLVALRTRVDAVMIGAGTMRAERYGRVVRDPAKRERREQEGLGPDPLMVIVSGTMDMPWDAPLFTEGVGHCLICTSSEDDPPKTRTDVSVLRQPGGVDLVVLLEQLRREHGVRALLCEGGAHLHAGLLSAGLVDELFVTHAPKLAGGSGPGLVEGMVEQVSELELAWLLYEPQTGELFGRYRLSREDVAASR